MEQKNEVYVKKGMWTAVYTSKLTVPTTSLVYKLIGNTYLEDVILNLNMMTTVEIDMTTPTVFFYNFNFENALMVKGVKNISVEIKTVQNKLAMSVLYPVVFDALLGKPAYTFKIAVDTAGNQVMVNTGVLGFRVLVTLPKMMMDPKLMIVANITKQDLQLFEVVIEKRGMMLTTKFTGSLHGYGFLSSLMM